MDYIQSRTRYSIFFMVLAIFAAVLLISGCEETTTQNTTGNENNNAGANETKNNTNLTQPVEEEEPPAVVDTDECYDSDDGIKGDVLGYVQTITGTRHDDACYDAKNLDEASCVDNQLKITRVACTYRCDRGACQPEERACTDSDNGDNSTIKGTVIDITGTERTDYCKNNLLLVEMNCDSKDKATQLEVICENGCDKGACK